MNPQSSTFAYSLRAQIRRASDVLRDEGIGTAAWKTLQAPGLILRTRMLRAKLKKWKQDPDLRHQVDHILGCKDLRPFQVRSELETMLAIVQERKPRTVVEIGTANGGTLYLLCRVAHPDAVIASLDLPAGKFGGGYSAWKLPLYRSFAGKSQTMYLLLGDSHSESSFRELSSTLGGRPVDFLFIDADHTYKGVKRDFELYSTLVDSGGLIGFHDIAPIAPNSDYGVRRLWDEIKDRYDSREIISDPNQRGFGIGLLRV